MKNKNFFGGFYLGILVGLLGLPVLKYWGFNYDFGRNSTQTVQKISVEHPVNNVSANEPPPNAPQGAEIKITDVSNLYAQEKNSTDWWYWVKDRIIFQLQPIGIYPEMNKTKLHFEYGIHGDQQLTISLWDKNKAHKIIINAKNGEKVVYDEVLDISPASLTRLTIASNGIAKPLNQNDNRLAAYIISNLKLTPI